MLNYTIVTLANGFEAVVACGMKTLYRGELRKTYQEAFKDALNFIDCLDDGSTSSYPYNSVRGSVTCIKTRKAL